MFAPLLMGITQAVDVESATRAERAEFERKLRFVKELMAFFDETSREDALYFLSKLDENAETLRATGDHSEADIAYVKVEFKKMLTNHAAGRYVFADLEPLSAD